MSTAFPRGAIALSRSHLQEHYPIFAQKCWTRKVRLQESFLDPVNEGWFIAKLSAIAALDIVASSGADNMLASSVDEQWLVTLH